MIKIEFKTFTFIIPPTISEKEFAYLKDNPKVRIEPSLNFIKTFKWQLIILAIGGLGLTLVALDLSEILNNVGIFIALIAFISSYQFVLSLFSFLEFVYDKLFFFKKLRNDIKRSKTYQDFLDYREKRGADLC